MNYYGLNVSIFTLQGHTIIRNVSSIKYDSNQIFLISDTNISKVKSFFLNEIISIDMIPDNESPEENSMWVEEIFD